MANNHMNGKFGEIAHQSTVVIQCTHDIKNMTDRMLAEKSQVVRFPGAPEPSLQIANTRIDIGDLVFSMGTRVRKNVLNNAIPAMSTLNGAMFPTSRIPKYVDINNVTEKEKEIIINNLLYKEIRFLGVALGATTPNPDEPGNAKTQFTCRVQGTMGIMNNGPDDIFPGDTVLWELPKKEWLTSSKFEKHVPRIGRDVNKVTLSTVPLRTASDNYVSSVINAVSKNDCNREFYETGGRKGRTMIDQFGADMAEFMLCTIYNYLVGMEDDIVKNNEGVNITFKEFMKSRSSETALEALTKNDKNFHNNVTKCVKTSADIFKDFRHRLVGKSLCYARTGAEIDILLGSN